MTREQLSDESKSKIDQLLPNMKKLLKIKHQLSLSKVVATPGKDTEGVAIAGICLFDAVWTIIRVRYALREAYSHLIYYRSKRPDAPDEANAIWFGRFYLDDAVLRLYPAGEDVAEFLINFFGITWDSVPEGRLISKASRIGTCLRNHETYKNHPATSLIKSLHDDDKWQQAIAYRNEWVHEQPPHFEGEGLVWNRGPFWEGGRLVLGGGDRPKHNVDEMLDTVTHATCQFCELLFGLTDMFMAKIASMGFEVTEDGERISINFNPLA